MLDITVNQPPISFPSLTQRGGLMDKEDVTSGFKGRRESAAVLGSHWERNGDADRQGGTTPFDVRRE